MPIPLPDLDDRSWADLVAQMVSRLPRTAPGWTDHNLSDPGITLLELYAWVTEALLFRTGRVPAPAVRAFLRRFGVEPSPARAASTVVAVRLPPVPDAQHLPAGSRVEGGRSAAHFTTAHPIDLSPAWLELSPDEPARRGTLESHAGGTVVDVTATNREQDGLFHPFGTRPAAGNALVLGFDVPPVAPGRSVRLQVWTEHAALDEQDRARLLAECDEPWQHPGVRTCWEYWTGAAGWRAARVVDDTTRGLTFSGGVLLADLEGHRPGPGDAQHRVRCRLLSGAGECLPRLSRVAVNAVAVRHAVPAAPPPAATSRGEAGTVLDLGTVPLVPGSLRLQVGGEEWHEVQDWDRSGPADRHVRLDAEHGTVQFGDGRAGLVPPAGAPVVVTAVETGGGPAGNLPAGALTRLPALPEATVVQPVAAAGGALAEQPAAARARVLRRLGTAHRGVTAADLEELARSVPGLPVARARALPGHHPGYPEFTVPGAVTVVVLPPCSRAPGCGLLGDVERYLRRRRPLGCELHVVGPGLVPVSVHATLHVTGPGAAQRASAALDAFLHPLTGGPAGDGWPFGRDVFRTEVAAVLADVVGVGDVSDLSLHGPEGPWPGPNATLAAADLVQVLPHLLTITED